MVRHVRRQPSACASALLQSSSQAPTGAARGNWICPHRWLHREDVHKHWHRFLYSYQIPIRTVPSSRPSFRGTLTPRVVSPVLINITETSKTKDSSDFRKRSNAFARKWRFFFHQPLLVITIFVESTSLVQLLLCSAEVLFMPWTE